MISEQQNSVRQNLRTTGIIAERRICPRLHMHFNFVESIHCAFENRSRFFDFFRLPTISRLPNLIWISKEWIANKINRGPLNNELDEV